MANNQPPYNSPAQRQPAYNQPPHNQPPNNQTAYNQPAYNQSPPGQQAYNQPANNQPPYNQPAHNQPPPGQLTYNQPAYSQPPAAQPVYNQPVNIQPPPAPREKKASVLFILSIAFLAIGLVLHIVAVATEAWIGWDPKIKPYTWIGLWEECDTVIKLNTVLREPSIPIRKHEYVCSDSVEHSYRAFAILGIIACVVAVVCALVGVLNRGQTRGMIWVCVAAGIFAFVCVIITISVVAYSISARRVIKEICDRLKKKSLFERCYHTMKERMIKIARKEIIEKLNIKYGYSFALSGIGGALMLVGSVLAAVAALKKLHVVK